MSGFTPLLPTTPKRPSGAFGSAAGLAILIRDQFSITTWLAFGAIAQGTALLLLGRIALVPAFAYLLIGALDTYLVTMGWRHNKLMDGVLLKKFAAVIPDSKGNYGNKPANEDIVVFLIGTRNNHPLGVLAPGFKEEADYFTNMVNVLEEQSEEYGMLGQTSWLNASARATGNETLVVYYFRNIEGLHKFAHSPHHTKAWQWWNKHTKQYPHLSIYHETYSVPKANWETIYINSHVNHLASASVKIQDEKTDEVLWASPVVNAKKGVLASAAGRMARSHGKDNDYLELADAYD